MTEQSALANMGQFEWDSTESVSYEVAIEAISQAAAAIAPLMATAREHNDETAIAELVSLRKQCIAARNELRPTDHQGVAAATQRYRAMAEQLGRRAA